MREARLAEALRDNLRRRKEQARARAADRDTGLPADARRDRATGGRGIRARRVERDPALA